MRWSKDKLDLLIDEYQYCNLYDLANKIGCTVKALTRKAEKLRLFRAKNNEIKDGIKYCTFCKTYHDKSQFYIDKAQNSNLRYNCKLYYENYKLKNRKQNTVTTTTLLNQKRGKSSNRDKNQILEKEKIKYRPVNPVVIKNGVEGKICNGCKTWKPLEAYGRDSKGIKKRRARCKDCYKLNSSK